MNDKVRKKLQQNRSKIKGVRLPPQKTAPIWRGPESDGVTFSLLSRFLCCRERFRLLVVEGLKSADTFNHRLEYGQMWHTCEEALAKRYSYDPEADNPSWRMLSSGGTDCWRGELREYCERLCRKYPMQQEEVQKWYEVCKVQFPIYVDYWSKHPDVVARTPLLQEQVFNVPYKLPSGRIVRLRGKWDSVDLVGRGKRAGVYLQENKTKGDVREGQIKRQLTFDLQTMLYLTALSYINDSDTPLKELDNHLFSSQKILGVRYNVIRRPLSGGKGTIVRHKATAHKPEETRESYYNRLRDIIASSPEEFFFRWKVEVSSQDIERFRRECLDPILEALCNWWDLVEDNAISRAEYLEHGLHWRTPYGIWNPQTEGAVDDLDEYLATGSEVGLERTSNLFPELT